MPVLLDGNNLLHRLPTADRSRAAVRRLVLDATRTERMSVTVVFDGPPPAGSPAEELLGRVLVIYSGPRTADEVILSKIPAGRAARQWIVVTDDRGLGRRARERGASVRALRQWQVRPRETPARRRVEAKLSSREVSEWEEFFRGRSENDS